MRVSAVFALASATLAVAQNSSNSSRTYTAEDLGPWAGEVTDTERSELFPSATKAIISMRSLRI